MAGSPKPGTIAAIVAALVVATISGSLLSDRIGPRVPDGFMTFGILATVFVIATLMSTLLGGNDAPENLGAMRRRLSETLGFIAALAIVAGAFWACVNYAPSWAKEVFAKDKVALNGKWSGVARPNDEDIDHKSTLKIDGPEDDLNGALIIGDCSWAVKGDVLSPGTKEKEFLEINKEKGSQRCPETGFLDVKLHHDRRISIKVHSWTDLSNGGRYNKYFNGVLNPVKAPKPTKAEQD
ncbi:hypothetical protein ABZT48_01220 [Streptomyces avermitilis]|uniref:hypothetical protein n=1 Tax=Streptomyces avermitilis TaxID=33903 RepID=UPI00339EA1AE